MILRMIVGPIKTVHQTNFHQFPLFSAPIAAPEVSLVPVGARSLQVEWRPLTPAQARGTVVQYDVISRKAGASAEKVERVQGTDTELLITGE